MPATDSCAVLVASQRLEHSFPAYMVRHQCPSGMLARLGQQHPAGAHIAHSPSSEGSGAPVGLGRA